MFMQQLFLLNGELADFKVGSHESEWGRRTFRGSEWENEVAEHFDDWNLTCEYKKILVNNNDEHNDAFELLEMWLDNSFKKYKKAGLVFMYEKVKDEPIEDNTIDDIEELEEFKYNEFVLMNREERFNKTMNEYSVINKLIQAVKQLNKEIKSIKENK